jgi:hypothetical protein
VVTVAAQDAAAFEALFGDLPCRRIGVVTAAPVVRATLGGRIRLNVPIAEMKAAYKETLAHV